MGGLDRPSFVMRESEGMFNKLSFREGNLTKRSFREGNLRKSTFKEDKLKHQNTQN